jgi:hypothetical protein
LFLFFVYKEESCVVSFIYAIIMLFCTKVKGYGENLLQNISDFICLCSTTCHPCWLIYMYMYQNVFLLLYNFFVHHYHSSSSFIRSPLLKDTSHYQVTFRCSIIVKKATIFISVEMAFWRGVHYFQVQYYSKILHCPNPLIRPLFLISVEVTF